MDDALIEKPPSPTPTTSTTKTSPTTVKRGKRVKENWWRERLGEHSRSGSLPDTLEPPNFMTTTGAPKKDVLICAPLWAAPPSDKDDGTLVCDKNGPGGINNPGKVQLPSKTNAPPKPAPGRGNKVVYNDPFAVKPGEKPAPGRGNKLNYKDPFAKDETAPELHRRKKKWEPIKPGEGEREDAKEEYQNGDDDDDDNNNNKQEEEVVVEQQEEEFAVEVEVGMGFESRKIDDEEEEEVLLVQVVEKTPRACEKEKVQEKMEEEEEEEEVEVLAEPKQGEEEEEEEVFMVEEKGLKPSPLVIDGDAGSREEEGDGAEAGSSEVGTFKSEEPTFCAMAPAAAGHHDETDSGKVTTCTCSHHKPSHAESEWSVSVRDPVLDEDVSSPVKTSSTWDPWKCIYACVPMVSPPGYPYVLYKITVTCPTLTEPQVFYRRFSELRSFHLKLIRDQIIPEETHFPSRMVGKAREIQKITWRQQEGPPSCKYIHLRARQLEQYLTKVFAMPGVTFSSPFLELWYGTDIQGQARPGPKAVPIEAPSEEEIDELQFRIDRNCQVCML